MNILYSLGKLSTWVYFTQAGVDFCYILLKNVCLNGNFTLCIVLVMLSTEVYAQNYVLFTLDDFSTMVYYTHVIVDFIIFLIKIV